MMKLKMILAMRSTEIVWNILIMISTVEIIIWMLILLKINLLFNKLLEIIVVLKISLVMKKNTNLQRYNLKFPRMLLVIMKRLVFQDKNSVMNYILVLFVLILKLMKVKLLTFLTLYQKFLIFVVMINLQFKTIMKIL